jgi:hypothetical protein
VSEDGELQKDARAALSAWQRGSMPVPVDERSGQRNRKRDIGREAADVGNMAMMVADRCGALAPVIGMTERSAGYDEAIADVVAWLRAHAVPRSLSLSEMLKRIEAGAARGARGKKPDGDG